MALRTETYFLPVLKAGSLRSWGQHSQVSAEISLAFRQLLSCCVLPWQRERALMSLPLLIKALTLMTPVNLNVFLKAPFPNIVTLGARASMYEFFKGTQFSPQHLLFSCLLFPSP